MQSGQVLRGGPHQLGAAPRSSIRSVHGFQGVRVFRFDLGGGRTQWSRTESTARLLGKCCLRQARDPYLSTIHFDPGARFGEPISYQWPFVTLTSLLVQFGQCLNKILKTHSLKSRTGIPACKLAGNIWNLSNARKREARTPVAVIHSQVSLARPLKGGLS